MEKLVIQEKHTSPEVVMDPDNSHFEISGKSFPEDAKLFYQPVLDYLERLNKDQFGQLDFKFNLSYLSSSSIIAVKQILYKLSDLNKIGFKVNVLWHYDEDDDDIKNTGENYQVLIEDLPFKFIPNDYIPS